MTDRHSGFKAAMASFPPPLLAFPGTDEQDSQAGAADVTHLAAVKHQAHVATLDYRGNLGLQVWPGDSVKPTIQ